MALNLKVFDRVIEGGLIFIIVFTPLAFGAVHVAAYTVMELTVIFLIVLWLLKLFLVNQKVAERKVEIRYSLLLPFFLFIGLILFQMLPLPPSVIKYLSPNTYKLYEQTLPGWPSLTNSSFISSKRSTSTEVANRKSQIAIHNWRSISIYKHTTKAELFKILAYIGVFFLIINNLVTEEQIKRLGVAIIIMGSVVAFLGIIQMASGTDKIYWFWQSVYWKERPPGFFGPYVNRNHFAGYMEMVIPLTIGFLIPYLPVSSFQGGSWRARIASLESRISKNILFIFVIVLMIAALFLSLSRGGIICFFLSILFLANFLLFYHRRRKRSTAAFLISIFVVSTLFLVWVGIDPLLDRLASLREPDKVSPLRPIVYKDTINIVKDFPLVGTGLGTFEDIYPRYKTVKTDLFFEHTHNDYLELLSDTGLSGALFLVGGVLLFLIVIMKRWAKRRDPFVVGIVLGGTTGILSILFHSTVDFNMHIPANAMLFFIILAMSYAAVRMRSHHRKTIKP
jgi:O-antigen ligase